MILGPLSERECERGVKDGVGCVDLYENMFLCGVDGAGGVMDLLLCWAID